MRVEDWGLIEYVKALERQKSCVLSVVQGAEDCLIVCEHPPVFTLGRMTNPRSLLCSKQQMQSRGASVVEVDRGGDVTLHAPGQLIVYPIFNLNRYDRDLKGYVTRLEQVAIDLLKNFDILAVRIAGQRGVFVGKDKIVSIGVGVRKWVSYHGLGINVNTDLSLFDGIKPCGLDLRMTSMQKIKGFEVSVDAVKAELLSLFKRVF